MKLVFVLSLLALNVCATPTGIVKNPKSIYIGRIFNGIVAEEGQFPYQVFIRSSTFDYTYECSGAILSKDWVITAYYSNFVSKNATVQVGSIFAKTYDPKRVIVESEIVYEYNSSNSVYTLALIKLKTPLTFNAYIQPIRIWKKPVPKDTVLTVSGWGGIRYKGARTNFLQYTSLRVLSEEECKMAFQESYDEYRMCGNTISSRFRHTCIGDDGSPLVFYGGPEPFLIGVAVESALLCGKENYASGFIKIHKYVDWIQNVTGLVIH